MSPLSTMIIHLHNKIYLYLPRLYYLVLTPNIMPLLLLLLVPTAAVASADFEVNDFAFFVLSTTAVAEALEEDELEEVAAPPCFFICVAVLGALLFEFPAATLLPLLPVTAFIGYTRTTLPIPTRTHADKKRNFR